MTEGYEPCHMQATLLKSMRCDAINHHYAVWRNQSTLLQSLRSMYVHKKHPYTHCPCGVFIQYLQCITKSHVCFPIDRVSAVYLYTVEILYVVYRSIYICSIVHSMNAPQILCTIHRVSAVYLFTCTVFMYIYSHMQSLQCMNLCTYTTINSIYI